MKRFNMAMCAATSLASVALLAVPQARAETYYVAPAPLGNDAQTGTEAAPFATIAKAQAVVSPGDTVYFKGGKYAYTAGTNTCASQTDTVKAIVLNKSGSAGKRIQYFAAPGETPIFDFSRMKDDCRVKGFHVTADYIHIKGFEVTGVPQHNNKNHESWGVWNSGSHNVFEQIDAHHNMGPGIFIQNGADNLVLNCDSHHNYDPLTSNGAGQSADGFGCHVAAGNKGNVFRGCRAWWNSDDGFDFINAFEVCTIENSWAWYHGYLPDTMTSLAAGNGNGIKAGGYGAAYVADAPQHIVRNCLSVANKSAGFYANHHPDSPYFYNNTSYGNNPDFNMLGINASGGSSTEGVYRNNIALGGVLFSNRSGADEASNSWTLAGVHVSEADFQNVSVAGLDAPRQADGSLPALSNFHLVADSDLIDKGTMVGLPFAGSAPDLGCFETGLSAAADGGTEDRDGGTLTAGDAGSTNGAADAATTTGGATDSGANAAGRDAGMESPGRPDGGSLATRDAATPPSRADAASSATADSGLGRDSLEPEPTDDSSEGGCRLSRRPGDLTGALPFMLLFALGWRRRRLRAAGGGEQRGGW